MNNTADSFFYYVDLMSKDTFKTICKQLPFWVVAFSGGVASGKQVNNNATEKVPKKQLPALGEAL